MINMPMVNFERIITCKFPVTYKAHMFQKQKRDASTSPWRRLMSHLRWKQQDEEPNLRNIKHGSVVIIVEPKDVRKHR